MVGASARQHTTRPRWLHRRRARVEVATPALQAVRQGCTPPLLPLALSGRCDRWRLRQQVPDAADLQVWLLHGEISVSVSFSNRHCLGCMG